MPFFETNRKPEFEIDYSRCQSVSVIANYNPAGKIRPVFVCLEDLYGNACKAKIEGVKYTKEMPGGYSFCCVYKSGNRLRECTLIFYIREHLWVLEGSY